MARSTMTKLDACAFCSMHNHGRCRGDGCACERRAHVPDVETAASMRIYENPADADLPIEERASRWHRKDEGR
jgi:hypothetical protein